jgi:hypothetical protein
MHLHPYVKYSFLMDQNGLKRNSPKRIHCGHTIPNFAHNNDLVLENESCQPVNTNAGSSLHSTF